jgi:hypothetical protein
MKQYIINEQLRAVLVNALRAGTFNFPAGQIMDISNALLACSEFKGNAEQEVPKEDATIK